MEKDNYQKEINKWQRELIDKAKQFPTAKYLINGANKDFYKELLKYK